jgi:hypothetical protein
MIISGANGDVMSFPFTKISYYFMALPVLSLKKFVACSLLSFSTYQKSIARGPL